MLAFLTRISVFAQEHSEEVEEFTNEKEDLYPHLNELIVGFLAFAVLFFFIWKWVLPRISKALDERRERIQGEMEAAERAKREADEMIAKYQEQIRDARAEAGKIIDEARKTAESMRKDLLDKAEEEARQVVARAQDEIRAERSRTVEELRRSVGEISIELASRVIGESLDASRHAQLIDRYIDELAAMGTPAGNGNGSGGSGSDGS